MATRLQDYYRSEILPKLKEELNLTNDIDVQAASRWAVDQILTLKEKLGEVPEP